MIIRDFVELVRARGLRCETETVGGELMLVVFEGV